ncbi:MAG: hypothetical protein WCI78_13255 [Mycobacterium sp.]
MASVSSVADETVSTVSKIGTAVAEGVLVTVQEVRTGIKQRRIRPRTVVVAAVIGLVGAAELPLLLAAGGAAVIVSKFKNQSALSGADEVPDTVDAVEQAD